MLNWLVPGKVDHPMANIKKARQMVVDLVAQDPFRVLQESTQWLDSINDTEGFRLSHRLELTDLLDRGAKHHQTRLAREYLEAPRLQKFYEGRLWNASFAFWKTLGAAYMRCIEQFQAGARGAGAVKKELPLIAGRALRALAMQMKWILLRYGRIEERIWRDVGRAYLFAESAGVTGQRLVMYPGPHGESSVQEEFLKALMLAVSAPDSLTPARIHVAERVVAHFGGHFFLQTKPGAHCRFVFDLNMHQSPARIGKSTRLGPMIRFFGPGHAAAALRRLIVEFERQGALPDEIGLGNKFDRSAVKPVLAHLEQCWADRAPTRTAPRSELATRITVVPGYAPVLRWVQAVADANSLEFSDPESAESWIVFNMSDGGYGAIVPPISEDWLTIGGLLGLRRETATGCRVGLVRRVSRDPYDQRRVGIQQLGSTAVPVKVAPATGAGVAVAGRMPDTAILLSTRPDRNGEIEILMRAGGYVEAQNVQLHVHKTYLAAPTALVQGGEDFDWARFKVVRAL